MTFSDRFPQSGACGPVVEYIVRNVDFRFHNHYRCDDCDIQWHDCWDSMCNDRCPNCNAEIEPYRSYEI
jgi:hypothetical protein